MVFEKHESWENWQIGGPPLKLTNIPNLAWQHTYCQQELSNAVYYWCLQHMGISDRILDPKTVLGIVCCSFENQILCT